MGEGERYASRGEKGFRLSSGSEKMSATCLGGGCEAMWCAETSWNPVQFSSAGVFSTCNLYLFRGIYNMEMAKDARVAVFIYM